MFTGIVEEVGRIREAGAAALEVAAQRALEGTALGDSIAVNGVCLTVARRGDGWFAADVMPETLRRSNLGMLGPGDSVNLERSLAHGGRLGGHVVQGHVDATGTVVDLTPEQEALLVTIAAPRHLLRYVVEKGYIAVDGASLTVVDCTEDAFRVSLVRFTLDHTIFSHWRVGDTVNLEVDILAKYAERLYGGAGAMRRGGDEATRREGEPRRHAQSAGWTSDSVLPPASTISLASSPPRLIAPAPLPLIPVEEALQRLRAGKMVLVTDDLRRENEADLIVAAEHATPEAITFMITHGRGLVCAALTADRLDALGLAPMVSPREHTEAHGTAFTISVDARTRTSTGISAQDRSATVRALIDPASQPADLLRPGHIFPLRAHPSGVIGRPGHTEAAVDLARLAGLAPAGVVCEVLGDDGQARRGEALLAYAARFGLGIITIADLIAYRWRYERLVERGGEALLPTRAANFRAIDFRDVTSGEHHLGLVLGDIAVGPPPLVRLHSECLTGDALGSLRCDCGDQLELSLSAIAREGRGALVYLRQEGRGIGLPAKLQAYALQDAGLDTVEANERLGYPADARHYGAGAQILRELGVTRVRLLTNNPRKVSALGEFGITVVERLPLLAPARPERARYLEAKRTKLGHLLPDDHHMAPFREPPKQSDRGEPRGESERSPVDGVVVSGREEVCVHGC